MTAALPASFGALPPRAPISEQVADRITGMIKSGNLRAGDRLPTEAQMALAFGISRPALREALKALTLMGVLESRQGGRYSVTDLSPSRLMQPFSLLLSAGGYDAEAHFEARALVDCELARGAARRADPDQRARLRRLATDGAYVTDDPVAFRLLDVEFHTLLNASAGNPYLLAVAQGLYDVGLDLRREASALPGVIETSVRQHEAIAEAVAAGDAEAAAEAYRTHLRHVRDTTLIVLAREAP